MEVFPLLLMVLKNMHVQGENLHRSAAVRRCLSTVSRWYPSMHVVSVLEYIYSRYHKCVKDMRNLTTAVDVAINTWYTRMRRWRIF